MPPHFIKVSGLKEVKKLTRKASIVGQSVVRKLSRYNDYQFNMINFVKDRVIFINTEMTLQTVTMNYDLASLVSRTEVFQKYVLKDSIWTV